MQLKYLVDGFEFHVNSESGSLTIREIGSEPIEVPHLVAIELIEVLRRKLYDHSDKSESIFNKLFK